MPRAWLAACLLATACAGPGANGSPTTATRGLPARWDQCEPIAFERLLEHGLPNAAPLAFEAASVEELARALDRMDANSVRAALLLAHDRHPSSAETLLSRLERREEGPRRNSDGGDVVAAAALAGFAEREAFAPRLAALAGGRRPHPDLEVRVECAATLLFLGDDRPVRFLLKVLRIDTWAGENDERDFATSPHTAWARWRAATALSRRAGVPRRYEADGSIESREREAERLERLIRNRSGAQD